MLWITPHKPHHYRGLLVMMMLSFIAIYVLMYAMVDRFANVLNSVNLSGER